MPYSGPSSAPARASAGRGGRGGTAPPPPRFQPQQAGGAGGGAPPPPPPSAQGSSGLSSFSSNPNAVPMGYDPNEGIEQVPWMDNRTADYADPAQQEQMLALQGQAGNRQSIDNYNQILNASISRKPNPGVFAETRAHLAGGMRNNFAAQREMQEAMNQRLALTGQYKNPSLGGQYGIGRG